MSMSSPALVSWLLLVFLAFFLRKISSFSLPLQPVWKEGLLPKAGTSSPVWCLEEAREKDRLTLV